MLAGEDALGAQFADVRPALRWPSYRNLPAGVDNSMEAGLTPWPWIMTDHSVHSKTDPIGHR